MADPASKSASFPSWLGWVSLLGNLLLVGVIAGHLLAGGLRPPEHRPPPQSRAPDADRALAEAIVSAVPEGERRAVRRELMQAWRAAGSEREALNAARRAVSAALVSEPFDRRAVEEALAGVREADSTVRGVLQDHLLDYFEAMPADQRARVVERLSEEGRRFPRRPGRVATDAPPPPPPPLD